MNSDQLYRALWGSNNGERWCLCVCIPEFPGDDHPTNKSYSCIPPMLGWLTSNLFTTASVGLAIALNVSIGAGIGQIPGVWIYKADEKATGYPTG